MKNRISFLLLMLLAVGALLPGVEAESALVIGGFDFIRSGDASFPIGASFSEARTAILSNYPTTIFTNFTSLADTNLAGVNILIIGTPATITNDISPLTAEEQTALGSFIQAGGAAILFIDNDSFSPLANTANNSFLAPFGMGSAGTINGPAYLPVTSPSQHVVTSSPYGTVSTYVQWVPGAITNLGPYATALATNDVGAALVVIDPGTISAGSGPVVVFSDISGFWDTDGSFPTNATLFLNAVEFCRNAPQVAPPLKLHIEKDGANVILHWPAAATEMVLEATTNGVNGGNWLQVTNVPTTIDAENFVTNEISDTTFYRLRSP